MQAKCEAVHYPYLLGHLRAGPALSSVSLQSSRTVPSRNEASPTHFSVGWLVRRAWALHGVRMSRKRPANDPPPPREDGAPLDRILNVLEETLMARSSLMEQTVHVQQCLHTANALHEMLLTAHANANRGVQMAIDEQSALMQLQMAAGTMAGTMRGLVNVR